MTITPSVIYFLSGLSTLMLLVGHDVKHNTTWTIFWLWRICIWLGLSADVWECHLSCLSWDDWDRQCDAPWRGVIVAVGRCGWPLIGMWGVRLWCLSWVSVWMAVVTGFVPGWRRCLALRLRQGACIRAQGLWVCLTSWSLQAVVTVSTS